MLYIDLLNKKFDTNPNNSINFFIKRLLNSQTNQAYGKDEEGLNLKSALYTVGVEDLKYLENNTKNYLLNHIDLINDLKVQLIPVYYEETSEIVVSETKYTNILLIVDYVLKNNTEINNYFDNYNIEG